MQRDAAAARTLSVDGYTRWVASESVDVVLDPFECENLVPETDNEVALDAICERRMGEETQRGEAVIHRDDDDVGREVDPLFKRKIGRVTVQVAYENRLFQVLKTFCFAYLHHGYKTIRGLRIHAY